MISVKNVSKTYKMKDGAEVKALDDISIDVSKGEILGIIGVSGSGKSTLLRILRGVESFDSGEIMIDDVDVKYDSNPYYFRKLREATAIHLQRSFGLWSETALQNVIRKLNGVKYGDEGLTDFNSAYEEFGEEARAILKVVGLEDKIDHFAPVLSGGEKQRLIMARQLAKKPKVLLLDEPATMSCPKTKQDILDAIKNINKEQFLELLVEADKKAQLIQTPVTYQNTAEKKKGKRKKADGESETANQKGKGPENAIDINSSRLRGLYTLAFLAKDYRTPFAVFNLVRFFCFFSPF